MNRRIFSQIFVFFCLLTLLPPVHSDAAVSTVDCHCFRDRAFSAENPSAFDPYLLATVQNRLFSHAFSLPRKEIVSAKMAGARGERLWVTYWLAKTSGRQVAEVKRLYEKASSWKTVVKQLSVDPESLGSNFWAALSDSNEVLMAWAVVTQVSKTFLKNPEEDYATLQQEGATLKEAILASVLAQTQERKSMDVFALARQGGSWGSLLVSAGQSVESLEAFLSRSFSVR